MTTIAGNAAFQRLIFIVGIVAVVAGLLAFKVSLDLILVFAIALLFLLISLQSLDFVVLLMLIAVPLTPSIRLANLPINADDLLPPYVLGLVFLKVAILKRQPKLRSPVTVPLIALLAWGTLAYLIVNIRTEINLRNALFFLKWFELHLAFFIPFMVINSTRKIKLFLWGMILAANAVAAVAMLQFFLGWPVFDATVWDPSLRSGRVTSTFSRPNTLAIYLIVNMVLAFYFGNVAWSEFGRKRRFFLVSSAVLMFLGFLATGSRAGIASIFLLLLLSFKLRQVIPWFVIIATLVAIGSMSGFFMGTDLGFEIFYATFTSQGVRGLTLASAFADPRWSTWSQILPRIMDSPIFGYGFSSFLESGTAHNYFLFIAAAIGIPGVVLAFFVFWQMLATTIRYARAAASPFLRHLAVAFVGCLAAMYVNSVFGETMIFSQLMIQTWFIFGMIIMGDRLARREAQEQAWTAERLAVNAWRQ